MKKRLLTAFIATITAASLLVGCGDSKKGDDTYVIGISQFAEHGSLDNCREGFIAGLAEEGLVEGEQITVTYKNAAADMSYATQIADVLVSEDVDLICGVATPSAQTAYNAAMDKKIPVIYCAVTDPVAAALSNEDGTPVGEITGTSDKLAVELQLEMIRNMLPDAKKIGIIYTTSEVNSVAAIAEYEEKVADYGFELVTKGINQTADISLAADALLEEVDCLNNLTDNTVVNSLPTILDKANAKNIPVFGSEVEQVKRGCLAAQGIDYVSLGKQTGRMAAKVLKGEAKASELSFELITETQLYYNSAVADMLSLDIADDVAAAAAETFTEIITGE